MSEKRRPVWQNSEQLMRLMKDSPRSGYSNWHLYGPFNVPTGIKVVAVLSKETVQASVYQYSLLTFEPNQDVPALRARITGLQLPARALETERELRRTFGSDLDAIIRDSEEHCAKEGLPLAMIAFGATIRGGIDVAYLYHPLLIDHSTQFYIPASKVVADLKLLVRNRQVKDN